jgi:glycosyltransferase involved in cell wall biosynthesis
MSVAMSADDFGAESPIEKAHVDKPEREAVGVSVVIPLVRVNSRPGEVVEALSEVLDARGCTYEFLIVVDGISGAALAEAEELTKTRSGKVRVIRFQQAFGESACLSKALELARGDVIVTSPDYLQIVAEDLGLLLDAVDEGYDLAAPVRHPRIDALLNRIQSGAFNLVMRRVLRAPMHDLNCCFRAVRKEVLEDMTLYGDVYRFLPAIAHRTGYRVKEVRVRHQAEFGGVGLFGVGVYMRRFIDLVGVAFLSRYTLRPLRFFGAVGGVLALVGGVITGSLIIQRLLMEDVALYQRPLFLLGLLLFVLGVQVIGFGLVGEIIIYTQARNLREYRIERIYE